MVNGARSFSFSCRHIRNCFIHKVSKSGHQSCDISLPGHHKKESYCHIVDLLLKLLHSHTVPCNRELGPLSPQIICSSKCFAILYAVTTNLLKGKAIMEVTDDSIHFKPAQISAGGIAQWQSIRLQIERSPVQLRLPPSIFLTHRCKGKP